MHSTAWTGTWAVEEVTVSSAVLCHFAEHPSSLLSASTIPQLSKRYFSRANAGPWTIDESSTISFRGETPRGLCSINCLAERSTRRSTGFNSWRSTTIQLAATVETFWCTRFRGIHRVDWTAREQRPLRVACSQEGAYEALEGQRRDCVAQLLSTATSSSPCFSLKPPILGNTDGKCKATLERDWRDKPFTTNRKIEPLFQTQPARNTRAGDGGIVETQRHEISIWLLQKTR